MYSPVSFPRRPYGVALGVFGLSLQIHSPLFVALPCAPGAVETPPADCLALGLPAGFSKAGGEDSELNLAFLGCLVWLQAPF